MNILVLIDFSATSLNALNYAYETANALKAQIFLLHIISDRKQYEREEEREEEIEGIKKEMIRLNRIYPHENRKDQPPGLSTINLIRQGKVQEVIGAVCKDKDIGLMILGTKDKHSPMEYLLGSVSTLLVQQATCPMIIVPQKSQIKPIRHIGIASDAEESNDSLLTFINGFSEKLQAEVKRVYVYPLPRDVSDKKEEIYNPTWMEDVVDPKAEMVVVRDLFVTRGLEYFIKKHEIDLLALFVPQRKGWQKYFHRSLSKRMVYHSLTPLLIWNEQMATR